MRSKPRVLSLTVDDELYDAVKAIARSLHITRAAFLRALIAAVVEDARNARQALEVQEVERGDDGA